MKIYLRIIFVVITLIWGVNLFSSCSGDNDEIENVINYKDLPASAQSFLNTYFNKVEVSKVDKLTEDDIIIYEVELSNGYYIDFNSKGEWTQVVAPDGMAVPSGIVPVEIIEYVTENYSGFSITEINTTGNGGYKIEIENLRNQGGAGLEIFFDAAFEATVVSNY